MLLIRSEKGIHPSSIRIEFEDFPQMAALLGQAIPGIAVEVDSRSEPREVNQIIWIKPVFSQPPGVSNRTRRLNLQMFNYILE